MRASAPEQVAARFAARLAALAGTTRLVEAGVQDSALEGIAEQAAPRSELHMTPPPADKTELIELLQAAY